MTRIQHKFRLDADYLALRPVAALAELAELQHILHGLVEKENLLGFLTQQKDYAGCVQSLTGDGSALSLLEETDTKPDFAAWKRLMWYFPHIEHFWFADGDVWRTNDREGVFFPDRYAAASTHGFEDGICEKTFQSTDDLLAFFSLLFNRTILNMSSLMLWIRSYNETHTDNIISIMEMQIVDDPILKNRITV